MNNPSGYTALDLVGFTDRGTYDPNYNYVANDLAHHGGSIWCCLIDDTKGIEPTAGVNWRFWVKDSQNGISDIVNVLGAKNLLPYPYYDGDSKTIADVTFSVDSDGIVHANGTSTTYCSYTFANYQSPLKLNAGKYILSNSVPLPLNVYLGVWYTTISPSTNTNLAALRLSNVEREFEITEEMAAKIENGEAYLLVRLASDSNQSGVTWDNMTLYPMIRPSGIEDATWQPYAKTNKELTAEVTQNSSDIQTLTNNVATNAANIQTLQKKLDKKIIFIGDSYQYGGGISGTGNRWAQGWLGVATTALGLTENIDFWHNEYPGIGFTTSQNFLTLLQNLSPAPSDASAITDIIVTGGLNDTSGVDNLNTTIPAFVSYCKNTYPNAKVHIGYIGNYGSNAQLRFNGKNVSVYYQKYANESGACFINNSQYLLHDTMYYTVDENWHPNQSGHNMIGYKMANYILNNEMEAIYGYHTTIFTNTGVFGEIEGTPHFSTLINNNLSILKSHSLLRFKYTGGGTQGIDISNGTQIKLGTIDACGINPAIGEYTSCNAVATFGHYDGHQFVYVTYPVKIIYEFDDQENRNIYLKTNAPYTLNTFNLWLSPFEIVADTNLT